MESPIIKLRATEKILEETRNELARTREELHNAKKRIEEITANRSSGCVGKNEMETTKTHKEWKERESGELANVIRNYMISRSLTLDVLDEAKRLVEDVYKSNATMKKPDESGKWYPETSDGIVVIRGKSILKP